MRAIAAAGTTDATDFVKKERRSDSPPLTENAAVDVHKSKAVTVLKDFMVITLTLDLRQIMREHTEQKVDMVKTKVR